MFNYVASIRMCTRSMCLCFVSPEYNKKWLGGDEEVQTAFHLPHPFALLPSFVEIFAPVYIDSLFLLRGYYIAAAAGNQAGRKYLVLSVSLYVL